MLNASSLSGTSIANPLARPPPQQCQRCSRLVVRAEDAPPLLAAKPALRPPPPRPKPAPAFQRLDPPRTRQARQENYDNRNTRPPNNFQGNGDSGHQNRQPQPVRTLEPPEVPSSDVSILGAEDQAPPPPRPPVSRPLPATNGAVAPKPRSLEGAIAPIRPTRPTRPQVEQSQSRENTSAPQQQRPPAAGRQALGGPQPAGDARGKGRVAVPGKGGYAKAEGDGCVSFCWINRTCSCIPPPLHMRYFESILFLSAWKLSSTGMPHRHPRSVIHCFQSSSFIPDF